MRSTTSEPKRFILPDRYRGKVASTGNLAARLALIDRIADLPGIDAVERNDELLPRRVDVFLRTDLADQVLKRRPGTFFLGIGPQGLTLQGLSRWERHQVLAHGWGELVDDQVRVFSPRNNEELDVIWKIVRRAYDRLYKPATLRNASPVMTTWQLPRVSRTYLQ